MAIAACVPRKGVLLAELLVRDVFRANRGSSAGRSPASARTDSCGQPSASACFPQLGWRNNTSNLLESPDPVGRTCWKSLSMAEPRRLQCPLVPNPAQQSLPSVQSQHQRREDKEGIFTHLLRQQVHILLVAAFGSVVQLYQSQGLDGKTLR